MNITKTHLISVPSCVKIHSGVIPISYLNGLNRIELVTSTLKPILIQGYLEHACPNKKYKNIVNYGIIVPN